MGIATTEDLSEPSTPTFKQLNGERVVVRVYTPRVQQPTLILKTYQSTKSIYSSPSLLFPMKHSPAVVRRVSPFSPNMSHNRRKTLSVRSALEHDSFHMKNPTVWVKYMIFLYYPGLRVVSLFRKLSPFASHDAFSAPFFFCPFTGTSVHRVARRSALSSVEDGLGLLAHRSLITEHYLPLFVAYW